MTNYASPQREAQKPSAFLSDAEGASDRVRFYEFDRFRIDTKRRLLTRDGEPIALKAKALDTLVLLVQHAGRLLEKEELMNRLWPDTAVEEANLTQNIFEVRKALGEVPGEQRFIATVARRGYRFVAEVRAIGDEASARDDVAAGDAAFQAAARRAPSASRAGRSSMQAWRGRLCCRSWVRGSTSRPGARHRSSPVPRRRPCAT